MNKESLKLVQFLNGVWDDIDDAIFDKMPDQEYDAYIEQFDEIRSLICFKFGHDIEQDQCGKPEHRTCMGCGKSETRIKKEESVEV